MTVSPTPEGVMGVAAFTRLLKEALEGDFPAVWVRGEVSGVKRSDNGHYYFALKEGRVAVLDCVVWRMQAMRLGFVPRDGLEVEAFGGLTVYEPRGRYQLTVRELRPAGLGALLVALEQLKQKLAAEGLFDAGRKRLLPRFPRRVGLVTSPVGAAVRDMVAVLRARWPAVRIVLAPVRVQGPGAADTIARAIRRFNQLGRADVLIVGRGGGSLEDLWAFNEESVVRAIAGSRIPVISAVGHEVDTTLADLAADARAATPSNAAELAVPDRRDVARVATDLHRRARRCLRLGIDERRRRIAELVAKYGFRRQRDAVAPMRQRADDLADRMRGALHGSLLRIRQRFLTMTNRYGLRSLPRRLTEHRRQLEGLNDRLGGAAGRVAGVHRRRLAAGSDRLRALSPRLVLDRGFCIVRRGDGSVVRSSQALVIGDAVSMEFARGQADARVERVHREDHDTA